MIRRLMQALSDRTENAVLPFFWQHGEEDALLVEGMEKIARSGIGAVCVESRPHPDFLGERWWHDLDLIMREAKRLGMRVWVLDDAHFPSGMCNGRITADSPYGKVYLSHVCVDAVGPLKGHGFMVRMDEGERFLGAVLGRVDREKPDTLTDVQDISGLEKYGTIWVDIPEGTWSVMILKTTRNGTGRKGYINTLDRDAVRFFIDTVYEPHYARYARDFGGTFAGFFSDEPEIGNGMAEHGHHLRAGQSDISLPWCRELEERLRQEWQEDFTVALASLFATAGTPSDPSGDDTSAARRVQFMQHVSMLYGRNFCTQIGDWCREHGAEYIGHVIEDDGRHAQLGLGTAHYFRALRGQSMAGIDVVLQQLRPEMDDFAFHTIGGIGTYNGEFFHYGLAKLGTSLARLTPGMQGRCMCEVFGAYGWAEGLKMMKWILDHMLVNGVNVFVPHAFTMNDFPDPDCPPHFYARGNNPQFPLFKDLMTYTRRVSHLITGGESRVCAAVVYTAEQEWAGEVIPFEKAVRELLRDQIDCCVVPADFLHGADIRDGRLYLSETSSVHTLVLCGSAYIPEDLAQSIAAAQRQGVQVLLYGAPVPRVLQESGPSRVLDLRDVQQVPSGTLAQAVREKGDWEIRARTASPCLRYLHYVHADADFWLLFNEGDHAAVSTVLELKETVSGALWYDPWLNRLETCEILNGGDPGSGVNLSLAPHEMQILAVPSVGNEMPDITPAPALTHEENLTDMKWEIALKRAGQDAWETTPWQSLQNITGPDGIPAFSGTIRYRAVLAYDGGPYARLDLGDVFETAEVFVNGEKAGARVAPPYLLDVGHLLRRGDNILEILVTNTLVHTQRDHFSMTLPIEPSGLLGPVRLLYTPE